MGEGGSLVALHNIILKYDEMECTPPLNLTEARIRELLENANIEPEHAGNGGNERDALRQAILDDIS